MSWFSRPGSCTCWACLLFLWFCLRFFTTLCSYLWNLWWIFISNLDRIGGDRLCNYRFYLVRAVSSRSRIFWGLCTLGLVKGSLLPLRNCWKLNDSHTRWLRQFYNPICRPSQKIMDWCTRRPKISLHKWAHKPTHRPFGVEVCLKSTSVGFRWIRHRLSGSVGCTEL